MLRYRYLLSGAILLFAVASPAQDPSGDDTAARLRESLRTTLLQLRAAEAEQARLQAAQAESETKIASLTAELDALRKRSDDDRQAAELATSRLNVQIEKLNERIAGYTDAIDKWKIAWHRSTAAHGKAESERSALAREKTVLQRRVADLETRNLELYRTGSEILERYRKFSFGKALLAREPFTGIAKARLEEQIQDVRDKLDDNRDGSPRAGQAQPQPETESTTTEPQKP